MADVPNLCKVILSADTVDSVYYISIYTTSPTIALCDFKLLGGPADARRKRRGYTDSSPAYIYTDGAAIQHNIPRMEFFHLSFFMLFFFSFFSKIIDRS